MSKQNRRNFLKSVSASVAAGMAFKFEEKALLAQPKSVTPAQQDQKNIKMPNGKLKDLNISRLICGGNLISGFAHSRDLIYVSPLLKHYFTDEKVMETLALCEDYGINTAILRLDNDTLRILNKYWHQNNGKIQWIAQCKLPSSDWKSDILRAINNGAYACYLHGGVAESLLGTSQQDMLAKAVQLIKDHRVIAGIAGHQIEVPMFVEKEGIEVDFYMKTLNAKNYWSAGPTPRHDSVWAETPEKTIEFMANVTKPWIAYKVLGAGAIHPQEGFHYAFANGADFICVGMFDFQIREDASLAETILNSSLDRKRPWRA